MLTRLFNKTYTISKVLNIPPLSDNYALAKVICYNNKSNKIGSIKTIIVFYWNRDVKRNSIKTNFTMKTNSKKHQTNLSYAMIIKN